MSIIKGKQNVVAGFGGTKRCLGEVYFSQSGLASDNPGALPGWTGEYYENGKTLFPDLYNFVKAHSELQVTKAQYDSAIATYGECPKYVVNENETTTTETDVAMFSKQADNGGTYLFRNDPPAVGNDYWFTNLSPSEIPDNIALQNPTGKITAVSFNSAGIVDTVTFGSDTTADWEGIGNATADITITTAGSGTSLRLPKYKNKGRYLVKSETNGSSWYNLYSDGWLEQGGISTGQTVTFLKTFVNTNYTLTTACEYGSGDANNNIHVEYANNGKTTTGFSWAISIGSYVKAFNWEAKGYAEDTPIENNKYPWISAYTSAIPASTAQAAEFIQTVSEMQTSKLDKAASNNFIGFVDTTAGISITLPYTATSNGWICCTWTGDNSASSGALAIDGVNVFYHASGSRDGRDSYWGYTALIPIRTGQVVTSTGTVPPNGNKLFFPFKNY